MLATLPFERECAQSVGGRLAVSAGAWIAGRRPIHRVLLHCTELGDWLACTQNEHTNSVPIYWAILGET